MKDKALQSMASMSSAQIVSATAIHNKLGLPGIPRPAFPGAAGVRRPPSPTSHCTHFSHSACRRANAFRSNPITHLPSSDKATNAKVKITGIHGTQYTSFFNQHMISGVYRWCVLVRIGCFIVLFLFFIYLLILQIWQGMISTGQPGSSQE